MWERQRVSAGCSQSVCLCGVSQVSAGEQRTSVKELENRRSQIEEKIWLLCLGAFSRRSEEKIYNDQDLDLMRKSRSPALEETSGIWFESRKLTTLLLGNRWVYYLNIFSQFLNFAVFNFTLTVFSCVKTHRPWPWNSLPSSPLDITACFEMFFLAPITISPASHLCLQTVRHESLSSQTENIFTASHRLLSVAVPRGCKCIVFGAGAR